MAKVVAATIQETLVALTIIVICFSMGMMVFLQVLNSDSYYINLKADLIAKNISLETIYEKRFFKESLNINGLYIEKIIEDYNQDKNLRLVYISVFKNDQLILEKKEIIIIHED